MYTGSSSYGFDGGGGRNGKDPIYLFCCISLRKWKHYMKRYWVFSVISSQPHWQNYYFPLADMLSWAVWFKFLLDKVIANTCSFLLTSFSKQSASWKVLDICELCALSTDSRKTYSVNKYMYTGRGSYGFDWGGRKKRKRPNFHFLLHQPSKMETLHEKMLGLFRYFLPAPLTKLLFPPPSWYAQLSSMVQVCA